MKLNGKEYKIPEFDFNAVCQLEELGIDLIGQNAKPLSTLRAFVALAVGATEKAGKELETHLANGGSLEEVMKEVNAALQKSGFFQRMQQREAGSR